MSVLESAEIDRLTEEGDDTELVKPSFQQVPNGCNAGDVEHSLFVDDATLATEVSTVCESDDENSDETDVDQDQFISEVLDEISSEEMDLDELVHASQAGTPKGVDAKHLANE